MTRSIVLFDMDGTLCDTQSQLIEIIIRVVTEDFGVPDDEARRVVPQIVRLPSREIPSAISQLIWGTPSEEIRAKFAAEIVTMTKLFPEVAEVLQRLQSSGRILILSTNTPEDVVEQRARGAGIRDQFAILLGVTFAAQGGVKKDDHPRIARERLAMTEDDFSASAVFVGDTASDMQMAKRAGLIGIARLTDENSDELRAAGADHVISDLRELEPLLETLP